MMDPMEITNMSHGIDEDYLRQLYEIDLLEGDQVDRAVDAWKEAMVETWLAEQPERPFVVTDVF